MFEPEDKLEITGSKVTFDEEQVIIASEVMRGDEVLKLRDGNGIPLFQVVGKISIQRVEIVIRLFLITFFA